MFQVRIHGRGGQGVVSAAEMLSVAAFREGRHAQAFPSFGSERTGAPVVAFCRIDDREIRSHELVALPDALIIQDPTLLHQVDLFHGLGADGYLLINTSKSCATLGVGELVAGLHPERCVTLPASEIARLTVGRPLPNAVLLGAFAALTGLISFEAVAAGIRDKFAGTLADGNVAGALRGYALARRPLMELAGAHAD